MLRARLTLHQWRMRRALHSFHDGDLSESERATLTRHASECLFCDAALRRLKENDALLTAARTEADSLPPEVSRAILQRALAAVTEKGGDEGRRERENEGTMVPPSLAPSFSRSLLPSSLRLPTYGVAALGLAVAAVAAVIIVRGHHTERGLRHGESSPDRAIASSPSNAAPAETAHGRPSPLTRSVAEARPDPAPDRDLDLRTASIQSSPRLVRPSLPVGGPDRPVAPEPDLFRLNEGALVAAHTSSPASVPAAAPAIPPLQERRPGSRIVNDLLFLNPILVAAADESGLGTAAAALTAEIDPRLQQKVVVRAVARPIADVLAGLSRATGVTLIARTEVADERVSIWAEDRTLMEVMRDLRHLYGYYWSRGRQGEQYVYSLWQDAESRAREDAEAQRLDLELQGEFQERVRSYLKALHTTEEDLRRLADEDPYLLARISHPVVRAGFQLLETLSPDQQAQLLHGRTPSRWLGGGGLLEMFPVEEYPVPLPSTPRGEVSVYPERLADMSPAGDIVTLDYREMNPAQRSAVAALLKGAAAQMEREAQRRRQEPERLVGYSYGVDEMLARNRVATEADLSTATVSLFRAGDPATQGIALRIDLQSGGHSWMVYSGFTGAMFIEKDMSERVRRGEMAEMAIPWAGGQEAVDRYRRGDRKRAAPAETGKTAPRPTGEKPDPILDRTLSFTWRLRPAGEFGYVLSSSELMAALHREIGRPIVQIGSAYLLQPKNGSSEFRWERRSVRVLLHRLYPESQVHTYEGAIFLRHPRRLTGRANQMPRAVEALLDAQLGHGPWTLDDLAHVARSLTPGQLSRIDDDYMSATQIDQVLATQELLKLYGELSPAQRETISKGLPFTALTPTQQALFVAFAQRHRPFVEPWRFQTGGLRLTTGSVPPHSLPGETWLVSRAVFTVRFQEGDERSFTVGLYDRRPRWYLHSPTELVGKPFTHPFNNWDPGREPKPVLTDARLRGKAQVVLFSYPLAEPYAGTRPPPDTRTWVRDVAARLRDVGLLVVHVPLDGAARSADAPNLISIPSPSGTFQGIGLILDRSPIAIVIDREEMVRAVFEGQDAWDIAAVERAARAVASARDVGVPAGAGADPGR